MRYFRPNYQHQFRYSESLVHVSIIQLSFLKKTMSLYAHHKYSFGIGIWNWATKIKGAPEYLIVNLKPPKCLRCGIKSFQIKSGEVLSLEKKNSLSPTNHFPAKTCHEIDGSFSSCCCTITGISKFCVKNNEAFFF